MQYNYEINVFPLPDIRVYRVPKSDNKRVDYAITFIGDL